MKKRVLSLFLSLAMFCTLLPTAALAAGSSIGDATPIAFGETVEGNFDENNENFYQLTLPESGTLAIQFEADIRQIKVLLYDSEGSHLWGKSNYFAADSNTGRINDGLSWNLPGGTYYICMQKYQYSGTYSLVTSHSPVEESFPEDSTGDNTLDTANEIELDQTYDGFFPTFMNDQDWYVVSIPASGNLALKFEADMKQIKVLLYDSEGSHLWGKSNYFVADSNTGRINDGLSWNLPDGTYYICMQKYQYSGTYSLVTSYSPVEESFPEGSTGDNTLDTANEIELDQTYNGFFPSFMNDQDWYVVSIPAAGKLTLTLEANMKQIKVLLYDSEGSHLWGKSNYFAADSHTGRINNEKSWDLSEGTYYICMQKYDYSGPYQLSLSFGEPEPEYVSITLKDNNGSKDRVLEIEKGNALSTPAEPSREGYAFDGWYSDDRCTKAWDFSTKIEKNVTLYAKWIALAPDTVTITLKDNNGSKDRVLEIEKGNALSTPAEPKRDGYAFDGWYSDDRCTKAWDFGAKIEKNITLYAKWTALAPDTVSVTLKANNGSKDQSLEVEKGKTMSSPAEPKREGYTFDGWYSNEGLTKAWNFSTKVNESMTLYGKWTEKAPDTVAVTLKTGTQDRTVQTEKGKPMNVPTNPTKEGNTFGGWYTDEDCSKAWNFNTAVEKDMTLYAKWTPVSSSATTTGKSSQSISVDGKKVTLDAYTLTADSNGGDVTYVKLRDVAEVLNGTQAQFNVEWLSGAIYVVPKTAYTTKNGTELKSIALRDNSFQWNTAPILFGGVTRPLEGIVLTDVNNGGHTFFKLRDLGQALGFKVDWSTEKGIFIETN